MSKNNLVNRLLLVFVLIFTVNLQTLAIEDNEHELFNPIEIKDGTEVSIVNCVANAFKYSPLIKRKKYNLDIAKSNLGIARSQYFPVIGAGIGFYNENNANNRDFNSHYREFPNVGVTVNQLVWNFGKTTAYIKMEDFYRIGAEYEFMDSLCFTLFNVKTKYYDLLKSKALLQVAKNNVDINKEFVKISKKEPDITTAKIHLQEANVEFVEAENNYKNAKVDLNNAMYLENQPNYTIKNTPTFGYDDDFAYNKPDNISAFTPQEFNFPREKAVDIAYKNSPDLRVLDATKNAMEQSLLYIKRTYFPDLIANAGYGYHDSNMVSSNNSFHVGVNLSSSVNLMQLKHSIKGADAQVHLADNEITLFKKDLYFRVSRAFNNVERSLNQIPNAKEEAIFALKNLNNVENKYKTGSVNYIALQQAREDYITANTKYIHCLYHYNLSLIEVEKALHYHIVDIHHKSEHAMHHHSNGIIDHLNEALRCNELEDKNNKAKQKKGYKKLDL